MTANGTRIQRQLKSSLNPDVALKLQDVTGNASSLRFDRLVQTFTHAGIDAADEYRLCATWQAPVITDALSALFELSDAAGTFAGFTTTRYRIDSARIWPDSEGPKLSVLCPSKEGSAPLTRDQVVAFCERFVIELALPSAKLDLDSPGPLEGLLLDLLMKDVGIGLYPNAKRRPEDAAALAIHIATNARIQGERLTPGDLASRLMLRTDFGRVLQQFPIDNSVTDRGGGEIALTRFENKPAYAPNRDAHGENNPNRLRNLCEQSNQDDEGEEGTETHVRPFALPCHNCNP